MLDVVLVLAVLILTGVTFLYEAGCDLFLNTDSTRDAGPAESRPGQAAFVRGINTPDLEHTAVDHPEYLVVGIISALIAIYLFVALLFPERF